MPRRPTDAELAFIAIRRVGHLATADSDRRPSVVPFCFAAVDHDGSPALVTPLDEKPKDVPLLELQRVKNILANDRVAVVVDDYSDVWSELGYVRIHGRAALVQSGEPGHAGAVAALREKYPQYRAMALDTRPLIRITGLTATSWGTAADPAREARPQSLDALIRGRRSVRALKPDPVPRELVERAIDAAGWAPSPHGRQPWRFAVVEAAARKEQLVEQMAASWREQLNLDGQDETIVQIRLDKSRRRIIEAPLIIVPCLYLDDLDAYPDPARQESERLMAVQSLGAAIQNLLLSLYASGLDSGWMCAPLFCPDVVRDALELPHALIPQALLPVGYAAKDPVRRPRRPLDDLIVDWR